MIEQEPDLRTKNANRHLYYREGMHRTTPRRPVCEDGALLFGTTTSRQEKSRRRLRSDHLGNTSTRSRSVLFREGEHRTTPNDNKNSLFDQLEDDIEEDDSVARSAAHRTSSLSSSPKVTRPMVKARSNSS